MAVRKTKITEVTVELKLEDSLYTCVKIKTSTNPDKTITFSLFSEKGNQEDKITSLMEWTHVTNVRDLVDKEINEILDIDGDVLGFASIDERSYIMIASRKQKRLQKRRIPFIMSNNKMEETNVLERLKEELKLNFPNDSSKEIEMKFNALENNDYPIESLELYMPTYKGNVLRVGLRVKGTDKVLFCTTEEGKVIEKLLKIE